MRGWGVWRALARYFPAELVKTAELVPKHSYIFALHPHGILTCNSWMNFSSEATGFSKLFPGIEMHTGTAQTACSSSWRQLQQETSSSAYALSFF